LTLRTGTDCPRRPVPALHWPSHGWHGSVASRMVFGLLPGWICHTQKSGQYRRETRDLLQPAWLSAARRQQLAPRSDFTRIGARGLGGWGALVRGGPVSGVTACQDVKVHQRPGAQRFRHHPCFVKRLRLKRPRRFFRANGRVKARPGPHRRPGGAVACAKRVRFENERLTARNGRRIRYFSARGRPSTWIRG